MRLGLLIDGRPAADTADGVRDLSGLLPAVPDHPRGALHALIVSGRALAAADVASAPLVAADAALWAPPLPLPGKIVGAPANYREHVAEMNNPTTIVEWGMFLKANTSVIGPGGVVQLPYTDVRTDHEGELAVVVGRTARDVDRRKALDYVFGYTCLLDITTRSSEDRSTRKSFDTFTPLGPWIVTADEVEDPNDLRLRCWVNDDLRQDCSTARFIFDVQRVIEYASAVMTLHPGDVIATGTPAGVGPLAAGDRVAVEIERIGRLTVRVSAERAVPYAQRPGVHPAPAVTL